VRAVFKATVLTTQCLEQTIDVLELLFDLRIFFPKNLGVYGSQVVNVTQDLQCIVEKIEFTQMDPLAWTVEDLLSHSPIAKQARIIWESVWPRTKKLFNDVITHSNFVSKLTSRLSMKVTDSNKLISGHLLSDQTHELLYNVCESEIERQNALDHLLFQDISKWQGVKEESLDLERVFDFISSPIDINTTIIIDSSSAKQEKQDLSLDGYGRMLFYVYHLIETLQLPTILGMETVQDHQPILDSRPRFWLVLELLYAQILLKHTAFFGFIPGRHWTKTEILCKQVHQQHVVPFLETLKAVAKPPLEDSNGMKILELAIETTLIHGKLYSQVLLELLKCFATLDKKGSAFASVLTSKFFFQPTDSILGRMFFIFQLVYYDKNHFFFFSSHLLRLLRKILESKFTTNTSSIYFHYCSKSKSSFTLRINFINKKLSFFHSRTYTWYTN
jgi:hypothetical protein